MSVQIAKATWEERKRVTVAPNCHSWLSHSEKTSEKFPHTWLLKVSNTAFACSGRLRSITKFKKYIGCVNKKASNKVNAFSRVTLFMSLAKENINELFFKSQFCYCSLVSNFHSGTINIKINH